MNYERIFARRASRYDDAMRSWPEARRDDFLLPLQWTSLRSGERVIDVPAGGGYLRRYLPQGCDWFGHEPCASFHKEGTVRDQSMLPLPFPDHFAHAAISIAGVHHLEDKRPLFGELARTLLPDGRLVLADVHADSAVARFLDDFVGRHNSTGHQGSYLDATTPTQLGMAGFTVLRAERLRYCWWFADAAEMTAFCRLLFDMEGIKDADVAEAIGQHLGTIERDGRIGMNWELHCLLATRAYRA